MEVTAFQIWRLTRKKVYLFIYSAQMSPRYPVSKYIINIGNLADL